MKQLAITAAVAATLTLGAVAQACPDHQVSHHVRTSRVHRAPERYYTANYDYSPGYTNYSPGYTYYNSPGYYNSWNSWDNGAYYNSYNNVGIGLGPFSIGF
jgi:hypothetical protein